MQPTNITQPAYFHKVVDCQWACPAQTPVPEYIRLIGQGEPLPVPIQPGVTVDKLALRKPQMMGDDGRFTVLKTDLAGPAATGRTSVALVEDGHVRSRLPPFKPLRLASARALEGRS